jgi:hypothetical protein
VLALNPPSSFQREQLEHSQVRLPELAVVATLV